VKALSLWQPWATLVAIGAKRIETRGWKTDYRGPLLIHAAKKWDRSLLRLTFEQPFRRVLEDAGVMHEFGDDEVLPLGKVVAMVELTDVRPTEAFRFISDQERAFGNYEAGRYGWTLDNTRRLYQPASIRGCQQLWRLAPEELQEVCWHRRIEHACFCGTHKAPTECVR
jgi:hypothetical protein